MAKMCGALNVFLVFFLLVVVIKCISIRSSPFPDSGAEGEKDEVVIISSKLEQEMDGDEQHQQQQQIKAETTGEEQQKLHQHHNHDHHHDHHQNNDEKGTNAVEQQPMAQRQQHHGGDRHQQKVKGTDNKEMTVDDNRTILRSNDSNLGRAESSNGASCYDSRLTNYINNGLHYYSHNMGQLSKYIIDQIKRAGYSGYWFVHAAMIGGQTQGLQWQSQSNGDIFAPSSRHGCYYHDTQTYIVIIRY